MERASTETFNVLSEPGSDSGREPVERLGEEYLARLRRGEHPDVEEYVARHPDLAGPIRDLFSALALVEDLKPRSGECDDRPGGSTLARGGQQVERLGDYRI